MMSDLNLCRCFQLTAFLCSFAILAGCDNSGRYSLEGKVTFDGEPVEKGYVQFSPLPGTSGPTSGADVKDGIYEVASSRGLFKGSYRVNVQAWKRSKKISIDPVTGEKFKGGDLKQILPPKYNDDSDLEIEIGGAQRTFDFNLDP